MKAWRWAVLGSVGVHGLLLLPFFQAPRAPPAAGQRAAEFTRVGLWSPTGSGPRVAAAPPAAEPGQGLRARRPVGGSAAAEVLPVEGAASGSGGSAERAPGAVAAPAGFGAPAAAPGAVGGPSGLAGAAGSTVLGEREAGPGAVAPATEGEAAPGLAAGSTGPRERGAALGPAAGSTGATGPASGAGAERGGASASGSGEGGAAGVDLTALVHARLAAVAEGCYPAAARRFRQRGTVELAFCTDAQGGAASSAVSRSSGAQLLDAAARGCVVERAAPFPAAAASRCFSVPVRFGAAQ